MSQRGKRIIAWACIVGMMVLTLSGSVVLFMQNTNEPVSTTQQQPEFQIIEGEIISIENEESMLRVTVKKEEEEVEMVVVENTYIGDSTKSPEKQMDFLEVGMSGMFIYAPAQGVNLAYTINILQ